MVKIKCYLPFSVENMILNTFSEGFDVRGAGKKKNINDNFLDSNVRE